MKKIAVLFFVLAFGGHAFAQNDTTAPYLKNRSIPAFNLITNDSTLLTQNILKEGKNTIFMLFNPDCDHCQKQLELLLSIPELAGSTQLILCSIETLAKNRDFYKRNHLEDYPFVHLGQDYKFYFGGFFQPRTIPMLAFYNKKGQFVLINNGNTKKEMIIDALKD